MIGIKDVKDAIKSVSKGEMGNQMHLDATSKVLVKLLDNQEQPVINALVEEIYADAIKTKNWQTLKHMCYSAPIEVATSFITNAKKKDTKNFNEWVKEPTSKEVFARIVRKIKIV